MSNQWNDNVSDAERTFRVGVFRSLVLNIRESILVVNLIKGRSVTSQSPIPHDESKYFTNPLMRIKALLMSDPQRTNAVKQMLAYAQNDALAKCRNSVSLDLKPVENFGVCSMTEKDFVSDSMFPTVIEMFSIYKYYGGQMMAASQSAAQHPSLRQLFVSRKGVWERISKGDFDSQLRPDLKIRMDQTKNRLQKYDAGLASTNRDVQQQNAQRSQGSQTQGARKPQNPRQTQPAQLQSGQPRGARQQALTSNIFPPTQLTANKRPLNQMSSSQTLSPPKKKLGKPARAKVPLPPRHVVVHPTKEVGNRYRVFLQAKHRDHVDKALRIIGSYGSASGIEVTPGNELLCGVYALAAAYATRTGAGIEQVWDKLIEAAPDFTVRPDGSLDGNFNISTLQIMLSKLDKKYSICLLTKLHGDDKSPDIDVRQVMLLDDPKIPDTEWLVILHDGSDYVGHYEFLGLNRQFWPRGQSTFYDFIQQNTEWREPVWLQQGAWNERKKIFRQPTQRELAQEQAEARYEEEQRRVDAVKKASLMQT